MLTVAEAAKRAGRDPETVRRWIRAGKLRSRKLGAQHVIDEQDLEAILDDDESLPLPPSWKRTIWGEPHPDWARMVRRSRDAH